MDGHLILLLPWLNYIIGDRIFIVSTCMAELTRTKRVILAECINIQYLERRKEIKSEIFLTRDRNRPNYDNICRNCSWAIVCSGSYDISKTTSALIFFDRLE